MAECSPDTYLLAAKELLVATGQGYTSLSAEQQALIQEAIEHIAQVQHSMEQHS